MQPSSRRASAATNPPLPVSAVPRIPDGKLARRIVGLLRLEPGRSWKPQEILEALKIPKAKGGGLRKELARLTKPGRDDSPPPIQRVGPTLYACFLGPGELAQLESPEPRVHGLQLVWKSPQNGGSPPRSRARTREAGFGELHRDGDWMHDEASRSWRCVRFYKAHRVTVQVFATTGTILASVDSSREPMGPLELGHLRTWLEATWQGAGFAWLEPRVATVEVNRDFKRVRLRGREAARFYLGRMGTSGDSLKLGQLEGALVQIYNKASLGVMRQEIRLQPRDLDLENLQALVTSMFYGPLPPEVQAMPLDGEPGGYA